MTKDEIALAIYVARKRIEWAQDDIARRVGTVAMNRREIACATESLSRLTALSRQLGWSAEIVPSSGT